MEQKTQAKILRDQLENATGQPEHVVAVNLDVRGFSSFCERNESPNVVVFIREVYKRLIDRCFPEAPFIKTTGDGLLIIIPFAEKILEKVANQTLYACLEAHEAFPSLCADEPMINFRVPGKIGIGLSRGLVSRIMANGTTLDYSGRVLNLASRLMNIARPTGIVFDCDYLTGLTPPQDLKKTFSKAKVWLWGIAESDPIQIYYSKAFRTRIPAMYKSRLDVRKWKKEKHSWSVESIELRAKKDLAVGFVLTDEPLYPEGIQVKILYPPNVASKMHSEGLQLERDEFKYDLRSGEPWVLINSGSLIQMLRQLGFLKKGACVIEYRYPL
jgi:class 3 adenylate cyclase